MLAVPVVPRKQLIPRGVYRFCTARSGPDFARCVVRYCPSIWCYETICTSLRACYAMSGTDLAYGAARRAWVGEDSCVPTGVSGTDLDYAALSVADIRNAARQSQVGGGGGLFQGGYAFWGTVLALSYAVSGTQRTDPAYGVCMLPTVPTPLPCYDRYDVAFWGTVLRPCYAMSGTDIAYACRLSLSLCDVRY
eukprot:1513074-Rhodomonas_salina.1